MDVLQLLICFIVCELIKGNLILALILSSTKKNDLLMLALCHNSVIGLVDENLVFHAIKPKAQNGFAMQIHITFLALQ